MQTMVREAWTDERLDDLSTRMDEGFRELRAETGALRAEMGELRAEVGQVREALGELRAEIKGLEKKFDAKFGAVDAKFSAVDKRFDDVMRTMQIGFGLIGAVLVALVGMVATQL